jgi:hypothetical protein
MKRNENFSCPHCGKEIEAAEVSSWRASQLGKATSEKKAAAARENAKKPRPRPETVICLKNIKVRETKMTTSVVRGVKVSDPHVTGWWLSYEFPDGKIVEKFYQKAAHTLKEAKHLFNKTCLDPRRSEYERKK